MTGLRTAFTTAAGDTDLSTRLFGEEASRGLDALQILGRRYDVVVTNPPYAGSGASSLARKTHLREAYSARQGAICTPHSSSDAASSGRETGCASGMVTQQRWFFLKSFAPLRATVLIDLHTSRRSHTLVQGRSRRSAARS